MPTIPTPPPDNSGGYMVIKYANSVDTHRARFHLRPFDGTGTFSAPSASSNPTVMAEFTALMAFLKYWHSSAWVFSLEAIYQETAPGVFAEIFGWTAPATVTGTNATATPNDQTRAAELTFNFRDGFGGRARVVLIGAGTVSPTTVPAIITGNAGTTGSPQLVDYLSTATKTNVVSHNGHTLQSPARITVSVNRRLRRHYGYA